MGAIAVCSLLAIAPAKGLSQRIETRDAGAGRKLELVYNAAGQVAETRTLGPDGKLQVRFEREYRDGYLVPQGTTTSYWPDGRARSVTRDTYDSNGNFTGETVAGFDDTGEQTSGTHLTHDPWSGVYRCSLWNVGAKAYQPTKCPAGEEESEAEEPAEITSQDAFTQVELARKARAQAEKLRRLRPLPPVRPPLTTVTKEVAVVLPAVLCPGERVSGSVIEDPSEYEGFPGLQVLRMSVPFSSAGAAASLGGWTFESPGSRPQRADGSVTFTVPNDAAAFQVLLRETGNPDHVVAQAVKVSAGAPRLEGATNFQAAALCLKASPCAVTGPFSGDSTRTLMAFARRTPAAAPTWIPIVAESKDSAYIGVPDTAEPGAASLLVADGPRMAALPVDIAEISFSPDEKVLNEGQFVLVHATLAGPEQLPDAVWRRGGDFPTGASFTRARALAPRFATPPRKLGGVLLLVFRNDMPGTFSWRDSEGEAYTFMLARDSFERGEFRYQFVIEARKSGSFKLHGDVVPFLAPGKGQQFEIKGAPQ